MKLHPKHVVMTLLLLAGLLMSVLTASFAYYTNGSFGFPLDDPWIHLQFAKNLHDYGSFSYYKGEMATSGSTAPLYTVILAAGFFVTNNEMVLSYVLGVTCFLVGALFMFRLSERLFSGGMVAAVTATLLFVWEPRLQWVALSGMETTLFILLILASLHYYLSERPIALGISAGLLIWTRPEAVILFGAIAADWVYRTIILRGKKKEYESSPWIRRAVIIALVIGAGYVLFNFLLSGSLLPNTYAAKLKYYSTSTINFPLEVMKYIFQGTQVVLAPFAAVGVIALLVDLARRRTNLLLIPVLFAVGMFLAYWMKLPYLYQNGRYMMPLLPVIVLLGMSGVGAVVTLLQKTLLRKEETVRRLEIVLSVIFVGAFAYGSWQNRHVYQDYCKYISDRQVRTAHWLREKLPQDAVVATHDVGAIAFYSERRIVDMVGLISPEMIQNIGNLNKLYGFLTQQGVTHLALLRNWFEVVNVNAMFQTNEVTPEIMEVFNYGPDRIHVTSKEVNWLTERSWQFLIRGDAQQGGPLIERAVKLDSLSSRAHHHFGWALMMVGQFERSEAELRLAIALNPSYWNAYFALAQVPLRQGKTREGIARLEKLVAMNPRMLPADQQLAQMYEQLGDTAKARYYLEQYTKGLEVDAKR